MVEALKLDVERLKQRIEWLEKKLNIVPDEKLEKGWYKGKDNVEMD